jgi:hypothetical protein
VGDEVHPWRTGLAAHQLDQLEQVLGGPLQHGTPRGLAEGRGDVVVEPVDPDGRRFDLAVVLLLSQASWPPLTSSR